MKPLRIDRLAKDARVAIATRSGVQYVIMVLDPKIALVRIQGGRFKEPAERILGGSYGPGAILWRRGFVRRGMSLRTIDPKSKYLDLEYPTDAVISWELLPEEPHRPRLPSFVRPLKK